MGINREMNGMDITSTAADRKKVEKMIKALVTKRLPFVRVKDVKVKPDVDIDGDPILEVHIIHDAPGGRAGDKTYGFRTVLHDALNEMGYPGFPITHFIWHKEYKEFA